MTKTKVIVSSLFLISLAIPHLSHASPISLGIQGGLNSSDLSISPSLATTNRSGIAFGGHVELSFAGLIYFQPEIMYIQKGAKEVATGATVKLDYLEFPMLLKFKIGITPAHIELLGGPYAAFLMGGKRDLNGTSTALADAREVDLGATFGVGAELGLGGTAVFANLRYSFGFTNTTDTAGVSRKNKGLLILAGLRFDLL